MKSGIGKILVGDRLFGPEMRQNPYPIYDELRESDPVHWDESLHAWVLTRYDDVALSLNDRRFSSRRVAHARERFQDERLAGPSQFVCNTWPLITHCRLLETSDATAARRAISLDSRTEPATCTSKTFASQTPPEKRFRGWERRTDTKRSTGARSGITP